MVFDGKLQMALVDLLPENATYSVCGGHIRIGLEGNTRVPGGELAKGSWEQAIWVRELARINNRPVATPEETWQILGLKKKACAV